MLERLLIRLHPIDDESHDGYFYRLAKSNHRNISDLLMVLTSDKSFQGSRQHKGPISLNEKFKALSGQLSKPLFDKRSLANEYRQLFDFQNQKLCPICLEEKPYIRAIWDFKHYVQCHVHHNLLENRCFECGASYSAACAISQKCRHCHSRISFADNKDCTTDPISQYIHDVMSDRQYETSDKLETIKTQTEFLEPYIRLLLDGDYRRAENMRKTDLRQYVQLQVKACELVPEEGRSVELLTTQLAKQIQNPQGVRGLSLVISRYASVTKEPEKHQFSNVIKRSLVSPEVEKSDHWLSIDFIAKLWQIDEGKLIKALDVVGEGLRTGKAKKRVKCSEFAKHVDQVLSVVNEMSAHDIDDEQQRI